MRYRKDMIKRIIPKERGIRMNIVFHLIRKNIILLKKVLKYCWLKMTVSTKIYNCLLNFRTDQKY